MQAVTSVLIAEDELLIAEALRRELEQQFNHLFDDEFVYKQSCIASRNFVAAHAGATENIIRYIQEKRLFTT